MQANVLIEAFTTKYSWESNGLKASIRFPLSKSESISVNRFFESFNDLFNKNSDIVIEVSVAGDKYYSLMKWMISNEDYHGLSISKLLDFNSQKTIQAFTNTYSALDEARKNVRKCITEAKKFDQEKLFEFYEVEGVLIHKNWLKYILKYPTEQEFESVLNKKNKQDIINLAIKENEVYQLEEN